jgi:hypothetical protein
MAPWVDEVPVQEPRVFREKLDDLALARFSVEQII